MSVLIVVGHPDDEVLGCGGTAAALAAAGVEVRACILSGQADARRNRPGRAELEADTRQAQRVLGIGEPILGDFPNIRFNTVPHLHLVQFVEEAIAATGATVLFTHHPDDLNDDHLHTSRAAQAAARLFQRREGVPALKAVYLMEVASSTDWAMASREPFRPDTFVPLQPAHLDAKLEALGAYRGVMRPAPHPRSCEVLRGHAAFRGAQAGVPLAEAFQTAFRRLDAGLPF